MNHEILKTAAARCFVHNLRPRFVHVENIVRVNEKKKMFIAELKAISRGGKAEHCLYGFRYDIKGEGFVLAYRLFKICGKEVDDDGNDPETE